MRRLMYLLVMLFSGLLANAQPTYFKVQIKNVGQAYQFSQVGVFNTPVGENAPAPIFPGGVYEFDFDAAPGSRLSLATMFVQSNDLFYAPNEQGIALYDDMGNPVSGDFTSSLLLWDAGTELNERPGEGINQAPRQAGPDTGNAERRRFVRLVRDRYEYPATEEVIGLEITHNGGISFTARIENRSTGATIGLSDGSSVAVPLAPGVFVVHSGNAPLFRRYKRDRGQGLEALAEDGDPSMLIAALEARTGVTNILAPGVYAVHGDDEPIFTEGVMDRGEGLEAIAEDGDPGMLAGILGEDNTLTSGVFAVPSRSRNAGPILPGHSYEFYVAAGRNGKLSFATMYVQSNDLFFAPAADGIPLFDGAGNPIRGDITNQIQLWDAGTEANEMPGFGLNQAPRQSGPNTGEMDPDNTVRLVNDGFMYPSVNEAIRVTIKPLPSTTFTVRVENVSKSRTLRTGYRSGVPVPLAPGFWTIHSETGSLFTNGAPDYGLGLEEIAEDGNPAVIAENLSMKMGTPRGVFNTPKGADGPGPLLPGDAYEFEVTAAPGFNLSLATMFVQSNDLFYAPGESGLPLFNKYGYPLRGDVTRYFDLWDAGTEMNEKPGVGPNQAPRQSGPNTGAADADNTVRPVNDGYYYPADERVIRVTIKPKRRYRHYDHWSLDAASEANTTNQSIDGIRVFPNPTSEVANLQLNTPKASEVTVRLMDINGRLLRQVFEGQTHAGLTDISTNVSDLNAGIYFFSIEMKDRVEIKRFVVE